MVRCPFHDDHTASLSIDLDRGIFHCFGCGIGGGAKRFRELIGEVEPSPSRPARPRSLLAEALARARREAERQRRRLAPYLDLYRIADSLRPRFQAVAEARRLATAMGDCERAWDLLEKASQVEREARATEAELDGLLPFPQEDLNAPVVGRAA